MDKEEMALAIKKLAKEIVEKSEDLKEVVLVGIMNRGVPIAQRISAHIKALSKIEVPVGALDVSMYRDDFHKKGAGIEVKTSDIPFSIEGKVVVLVDDVISAGRTVRAALDGLADYGRASKVELVALIDRDRRELPINPDYTGKKVAVPASDEVQVSVSEIDGVDKVTTK
jgi:pyrimidine operon attenuation protein / uracil phosphoribosyltransferase